ncbi:MAG: class I SAM-dependent methyltransferase [Alphaproteobacteria bacterium]|nr:class I SAM-dependent methyltransferase [Alphaproteobacteria bacterium]
MQFIHPMPSEQEWDDYNSSYFENAHGGVSTWPWVKAYNSGVAKTRLHALLAYLEATDINVKSVLEIGPGQGYLMREWLARHPGTSYYVVESDESVHPELKASGGIIVPASQIDTIGKVDLVIATHVIEHTLKPVEFLSYFTSALRKGGGVFIEAPCLDHKYKTIFEPHVQFFEKSTLAACFDAVGLRNLHLTYNGDPISSLRRNALLRKILVKLQLKTRLPFRLFLGSYWPARSISNLSPIEALALVETSPHIVQDQESRWVRGFAQREI